MMMKSLKSVFTVMCFSTLPEPVSLSISLLNHFLCVFVVGIVNGVIVNQWILLAIFQLYVNWLEDWWDVSIHPSFFHISDCFCCIWVIWIRDSSINPFSINILIEISVNPKLYYFVIVELNINWLIDGRYISKFHPLFFIGIAFRACGSFGNGGPSTYLQDLHF